MLILVLAVLSFLPSSVKACGGTFTASTGTLQSPGFPGNYANNLDCAYIIRRPAGERVTVTFQQLDLQGTCTQDFLELHDGDSSISPRIVTVCGTELEAPKRSFQNNMYVRFQTDGSETGTGFSLSYTSAVLPDKFFLIPASNRAIFRMDLDTTSNIVIPGLSLLNPIAVDFDPVERRVYWTDVLFKTISSAYLNGTGQKVLRTLNAPAVLDGLAVDPVTRLVFYTDAGNDVISIMTISGSSHKIVITTGLDQPRAIVLDTIKGVMFWTDWGTTAKIERANYDGTDRRTIITGLLIAPNAVALDLANQRIYWIDAGTDWVEFSDLDGNDRTQLNMFAGRHFFGLAYYNDYLYVTDWTAAGANTAVSAIHKLGTKDSTAETLGSGSFRMNDIHIYAEDALEKGPNGCGSNNGGCSYFCIPLPSNASKCTCPDAPTACVDDLTTATTTTAKPTIAAPATTTSTTTTTTPEATTTTTITTPMPTTTSTTTAPPTKVNIAGPDLFDTNGYQDMTLTCDSDNQKPASSVIWSVTCAGQQNRKCVWRPKPPEDDGRVVTCSIAYADGQSGVGSFTVQLNYPPFAAPTISGYKTGEALKAGDSLTMTCLVHDGKPLVTSVIFSCPGYPDSVSDVRGDTGVQSILTISSLQSKDDGTRCVCTAEWKRSEWYVLSASRILSVTAGNVTSDPPNGPPVALIGGAAAGGGVLLLLIIIIVVVVAIRRKRKERYEQPKRLTRRREPEAQENPYDKLGRPRNPGIRNISNPFLDDVKHFSSIYDEIGHMEETLEAPAEDYIHPVALHTDYLHPTGPAPPVCGRTLPVEYLHPTGSVPASYDNAQPVDTSSDYLHPKGTVPAIYDPTKSEYSMKIQRDA